MKPIQANVTTRLRTFLFWCASPAHCDTMDGRYFASTLTHSPFPTSLSGFTTRTMMALIRHYHVGYRTHRWLGSLARPSRDIIMTILAIKGDSNNRACCC
ncbi:hypothetical protein BC827DRAFT_903300 [Russula dissimulans]|nr:hypothetical protein BC827DRAFT_903300 [Russula dissimulans]